MIKLNDPHDFEDAPIRLIDLEKPGLEKEAACSAINDFLATLKPVPNRSYFHVNMLGAGEYFGATKNGDWFPEAALIKYHKTFETAKLYKHHINRETSPSFGRVVFSTVNLTMHRLELVVEADEATSLEINSAIANGLYPKTSMACAIPWDTCVICGNQARTRADYCDHLRHNMNKLYPDGRKVYSINSENIRWKDCSLVFRPADPCSSVLTKVAEDFPVMGSAERAELEGLQEKKATIKKWSELIKDISEGGEVLQNVSTSNILKNTRDLPHSLIPILAQYDLNQSLTALATLGISPSIDFLSELIAKVHLGNGYEGIGSLVEEYMEHVPEDSMVPAMEIESPTEPINMSLLSSLVPYVGASSLLSSEIEKRASGVGYAHNGPRVEPTHEEELAALLAIQPQTKNFEISYGKLLLGLGASALLAKYFISSEIEKRMREEINMHVPVNYAKISMLTKRANYVVASSLGKASIAPYTLQKQREDDGNMQGLRMARKLLKSTKTRVGGKLASMLKLVGLASKVNDVVLN